MHRPILPSISLREERLDGYSRLAVAPLRCDRAEREGENRE